MVCLSCLRSSKRGWVELEKAGRQNQALTTLPALLGVCVCVCVGTYCTALHCTDSIDSPAPARPPAPPVVFIFRLGFVQEHSTLHVMLPT